MHTREEAIRYLQTFKNEIAAKKEQLDKQLEHLNSTIAMLLEPPVQAHVTLHLSNEATVFPVNKVRNMTQKQALVTIAKHFGGTVKAQEAKRIMIQAGVMRETKNSTNIIHAVILRSDLFERTGTPGEYRLKEQNQKGEGTIFEVPVQ